MSKNPVASISALLKYYSFDLGGHAAEYVAEGWLEEYSVKWVISAIVEAIFQGRYKAASVDNILLNWYLNNRPQHHFDSEFADLVCSKLFKTIPSEIKAVEQPIEKPIEKPLSPAVDIPFKQLLSPTESLKQPYSLQPITTTSNLPNRGLSQWLKFITKL